MEGLASFSRGNLIEQASSVCQMQEKTKTSVSVAGAI